MFTRLAFLSLAAVAMAPASYAHAGEAARPTANGNIVAAAASSPSHKTLVAAVKAAGLVDTLASGGPFTVFAPTDGAFAKLPTGTLDTLLQPANKGLLTSILTYHVVPEAISAAQLVDRIKAGKGTATLTTVQGGTLKARLVNGKVVIADAKGGAATVVAADLVQSNGIIHVTDTVSLPN